MDKVFKNSKAGLFSFNLENTEITVDITNVSIPKDYYKQCEDLDICSGIEGGLFVASMLEARFPIFNDYELIDSKFYASDNEEGKVNVRLDFKYSPSPIKNRYHKDSELSI